MDNQVSRDTGSDDHSGDCSEIEDCTEDYFSTNTDHMKITSGMNSWIKDGQWGICYRMKDLLTGSNVRDNTRNPYSIGPLPMHVSEHYDDEAEDEENEEQLVEMDNINVPGRMVRCERKIKHLPPFFTMINCDESGDTQYKEMNSNPKCKKNIFSLEALQKKIQRRNGLLNKFGNVHKITNLS